MPTFAASSGAEVTHSNNIIIADVFYVTTALCGSQVMDSFLSMEGASAPDLLTDKNPLSVTPIIGYSRCSHSWSFFHSNHSKSWKHSTRFETSHTM